MNKFFGGKRTRFSFAVLLLSASLFSISVFRNAAANDASRIQNKTAVHKIPLLIVLLEFSDCKLTFTDEDWNLKVFSTPTKEMEAQRFDLFGVNGTSLNNYYNEVTCGKFQFVPASENSGTLNDGVIRVRIDEKHPIASVDAMRKIIGQAVEKVSRHINFSKYDANGDKTLAAKELALIFVSAGGEADGKYSRNRCYYGKLKLGGCRKNEYVVISERRDDIRAKYAELAKKAGIEVKYKDFPVGLGTIVHELGHAFGTIDLPFTGRLTAMGNGQKNCQPALFPGTKLEYMKNSPSHYGAYTMVKAGFVEPTILEKSGVYTINSAGTGKYNVYKIPTKNPKEYFLIENRQFDGFDNGLRFADKSLKKAGIAIWHVNEEFGKTEDAEKQRLDIEGASEGTLGNANGKNAALKRLANPFYSQGGNAEFSSKSTPNNHTYAGEPQPWAITDFSASDKVMTFRFTRM